MKKQRVTLTESTVRKLRKDYRLGKRITWLMKKYNVSRSTVGRKIGLIPEQAWDKANGRNIPGIKRRLVRRIIDPKKKTVASKPIVKITKKPPTLPAVDKTINTAFNPLKSFIEGLIEGQLMSLNTGNLTKEEAKYIEGLNDASEKILMKAREIG